MDKTHVVVFLLLLPRQEKIILKVGTFSNSVAKCILHVALGISFTVEEDKGKRV